MAITKEIIEDKIEIVGESKAIQIREATVIKEDGKELTRTFARKVIHCITSTHDGGKWTHVDTDISNESEAVQNIAKVVWTDEAKAFLSASNEANSEIT